MGTGTVPVAHAVHLHRMEWSSHIVYLQNSSFDLGRARSSGGITFLSPDSHFRSRIQ